MRSLFVWPAFSMGLGEGESLHEHNSASIAFSPDGTRLAYVANQGSERAIHLRHLDQSEAVRLEGTERASSPVFSPDGEWIAFEAGSKLKKVHTGGGKPDFIANVAFFTGATWGPDDVIVYTPSFMRGLFAISARGGETRQITTPESGHAHIWPEFLPGGNHVLYSIWTGGSYDQGKIAVVSLETGDSTVVHENGFYGRYSPSGHLLYMRANTLYAVGFDLTTLAVTGSGVPVAEGVQYDAIDGAGYYAASSNALIYAAQGEHGHARPLVWVDRSGPNGRP